MARGRRPFPPFDPATSDGCTGVRDIARHCCVEHDKAYWEGRTEADRLAADQQLRACIQEAGGPGFWLLSHIRYAGVRLFGARAFWNKPHKRGAA